MTTGKHDITTTIETNHNNNAGFVPPSARRKIRTRTIQRRMHHRQNLILGTFVVAITFLFIALSVLNNNSSVDYYQNKIDPNKKRNLNNNHHKNTENAVDLPTRKNAGGGRIEEDTVVVVDRNKNLRGGDEERNIWVSQDSQPFNERGLAEIAQHLVMVAGHSVTVSGHLKDAGSDEKDWFLLSYQKGQGLPQAIHAHIAAGIAEAQKDPNSLLVFSGGETRAASGPQTEAQAYYHVADAMDLWPTDDGSSVRARTITEEFATDSFENLMFSIARFREVTGDYPKKITVVSFSFKRRRFETLHVPALRWPADRFVYVGVDPPASTGFDLQRSTEGESKNAAAPFEQDPYGCHSAVLQEKRKGRNPFKRTPPYGLSCPEMKDLLTFCGPELVPIDQTPWGNDF